MLTVRAGERVELTFNNTDDMPHNVVIFRRGSIASYEKELFGSMNEPNAQLRGFVPDSPNVLVASRLLNAGESAVITFTAPAGTGRISIRVFLPWSLVHHARRAQGGVTASVMVRALAASLPKVNVPRSAISRAPRRNAP